MRIQAIVRLELRRLRRAPGIWLAGLAFTILLVGGAILPLFALEERDSELATALLLGPATEVVLPMIAILLSYGAIATLRENGGIKVILGPPIDRNTLLWGVFVARALVISAIVILGTIATAGVITVVSSPPPLRAIAGFFVFSLLAGVNFVAIGVATSAVFATRVRAIAALLAGFVVTHAIWDPLISGVRAITGASADDWWIRLGTWINPLGAYTRALNGVLPPSPHLTVRVDDAGVQAEAGEYVGETLTTLELTAAVVVLLCWAIGCWLLARWRFATQSLA